MPQYFTLSEAEALLPEVEKSIRAAVELKRFYDQAEEVLQNESTRIMMSGGAMVNSERLQAEKSRRDTCARQLKEAIERIYSFGCEVKDLEIGLIDFITLYHGQEVCLCWKLGEEGIEHWHGLEEGFRGRKKIDAEFLENHRGAREM
ncbi:MAG TPA: DUF2203 domain-containing protein [Bryobacteraceae bacterium]|nr:DUF2203 domain-containing protein [Bryobacteraceae bacterium]